MAQTALVRLCSAAEVAPGAARKCVVSGLPPLAVFNVDGRFFVTDDTCTHGMASLAEGALDGDVIECPWHAGAFNVRTGEAVAPPCTAPIKTYAVTMRGADVCVDSPFASPPPSASMGAPATAADHPPPNGQQQGRSGQMTLDELTAHVRKTVGDESGLNATVKFVFPNEGILYIDGLSKPNSVSNDDKDSTITITVSRENFENIINNRLNPKLALMTGKLRLRGDIRIAMRLDRVFGLE